MNCQQIRNRILAVEDANRLPEELAAHLDDCAVCQTWHRQCLAVNQALARLSVPPSDGLAKIAVLEAIRETPAPKRNKLANGPPMPRRQPKPLPLDREPQPLPPDRTVEPLPLPERSPKRHSAPAVGRDSEPAPRPAEPPLPLPEMVLNHIPAPAVEPDTKPLRFNLEDDLPKRKWSFGHYAARFWPAGLVAATLLFATIAWFSLRGDRPRPVIPTPADPLLDNLVQLNVELAETKTPAERVKVLARLADELNHEMREIARADATGENMQALEEMYRNVILNGLVDQAKLVERSQREVVLVKIVDGLVQSAKKAEDAAKQAPEHSASALNAAADTARDGTKRIRRLIQEANL
jgi:hypothetical protein